MSKLISGKEALIALANGEEVERSPISLKDADEKYWTSENVNNFTINDFLGTHWIFRLKPRTVNLNGVEVPSVKYVAHSGGNCVKISCECPEDAAAIGAALRSVFGKK